MLCRGEFMLCFAFCFVNKVFTQIFLERVKKPSDTPCNYSAFVHKQANLNFATSEL